jgi:tryptophanyl-tRNA synthetase
LTLAAEILALGVDPAKCILFRQADVLEHTQLAWILSCITPMGYLERMTQYKSKRDDHSKLMLLAYPVLMAADILGLRPDYVIVGEDQLQHIELANDLFRRSNISYRIKPHLSATPRVKSIKDPAVKMSKSAGDDHCLYLFNEDYHKKLAKAPSTPEGIANLRLIAEGLGVNEFYSDNMARTKKLIADRMAELFV